MNTVLVQNFQNTAEDFRTAIQTFTTLKQP